MVNSKICQITYGGIMLDNSGLRAKLAAQYPRYRNWEVFKIFESELADVSRYIAICEDNFQTYSAELSSLLLRICAEIEIVRNRMTGVKDNNGKAAKELTIKFPEIVNVRARLPLWELEFCPWSNLPANKPDWWNAYGNIKHDNYSSTVSGNLEYFLKSLSALYILLIYYDRFVYSHKDHDDNDCVSFEFNIIMSSYFKIKHPKIILDFAFYGENTPILIWKQ